jgi:hypothetical protein
MTWLELLGVVLGGWIAVSVPLGVAVARVLGAVSPSRGSGTQTAKVQALAAGSNG